MRNTKKYFDLPYNPELTIRARELRTAGNLAEVLLWLQLKKKSQDNTPSPENFREGVRVAYLMNSAQLDFFYYFKSIHTAGNGQSIYDFCYVLLLYHAGEYVQSRPRTGKIINY